MGFRKLSTSLSNSYKREGNPNPNYYIINKIHEYGKYLIIEINYPDCRNYEGNKILLYKDITLPQLIKQGSIDPHFSDYEDEISPIARFAPTKEGLEMAKILCILLDR